MDAMENSIKKDIQNHEGDGVEIKTDYGSTRFYRTGAGSGIEKGVSFV